MKYLVMFILLLFTITFSCRTKSRNTQTTINDTTNIESGVVNNSDNNLNTQTNFFVEIDSSGILMFPLLIGISKERDSYYSGSQASNYWNIIFYNSTTGEYYLLSDSKKMLIANMDQYAGSEGGINSIRQVKNYLFFRITVTDYNGDKKLTSEDPDYLFITDKEGKNLRQISPDNLDILSWKWIKASNKVVMTVVKDTDNNKKFNDKDVITSYETKMDTISAPVETFPNNFRRKINDLYTKDWKH